MRFVFRWMAVWLMVVGARLPGQVATNAAAPLSVRVVGYAIDARVDMEHKTLDATETLTYRNLTGAPQTSFPFHLYLNAFRAQSTFTRETHFGGGIRDNEAGNEYPASKVGGITLSALTVDGVGDVLGGMKFAAPDDGNAEDHTVAVVTLPRAVVPGETVTFRMRFHDAFPESVARNGYKRDFMMGGQWYPKLGVFWHGAWNCHQYHATTEFFSDFGTFDVRLTLPKRFVVGASGVPMGETAQANGTRTLRFVAEDVGDFAFAASPNFEVTDGVFQSSVGPVQVHVLALKAHPGAGQRYLRILQESMGEFDRRYGPYPYKRLTLVDPEPDSEMSGMEYPTLVTGDTGIWDPTYLTELTAEHEFGHQYWYGMVATNEFEDAWLDEGINSYTEGKVLGAVLGERTSAFSKAWASASDPELEYSEYWPEAAYDPVVRHAWQFVNAASYGGVTYGKSALLLGTLEGLIGTAAMDEAMRTYFMRYRFTHPTTEDFLKTVEEVASARGRAAGVDAFLQQAVYGTAVLDYAVEHVRSGPAEWWKPAEGQKRFRSEVTVHRIGDFRMPVTLEVVFADGARVRERWDGAGTDNDRWHTFVYERGAKIASAEVDPDHVLSLDHDRFNNSYRVKADGVPARKMATVYGSAVQLFAQVVGYLI